MKTRAKKKVCYKCEKSIKTGHQRFIKNTIWVQEWMCSSCYVALGKPKPQAITK